MSARIDARIWAEVARWLVYVDEDLGVVDVLMSRRETNLRPAGFHCQQAAEKMGKALLIAFGADVPKTHDIEELTFRLAALHQASAARLKRVASSSGWYAAVRYPNVEIEFQPTRQDIESMRSLLKDLRSYIDTLAPTPRA